MLQLQPNAPVQIPCANNCGADPFNRDNSHRFGVGISHYTKNENGEYVRSYAQVFSTQHCCSRSCALATVKARIDAHSSIPFGKYAPAIHNPDGEQSHAVARANVEYNQDGILADSQLPKSCAVCHQDLTGKDVYIPHVDDSTRGTHYQDILQRQYPGLTIEQATLGACSLNHAQELANAIIDEIIEPDYQGKALQLIPSPVKPEEEEVIPHEAT